MRARNKKGALSSNQEPWWYIINFSSYCFLLCFNTHRDLYTLPIQQQKRKASPSTVGCYICLYLLLIVGEGRIDCKKIVFFASVRENNINKIIACMMLLGASFTVLMEIRVLWQYCTVALRTRTDRHLRAAGY